MHRLAGQDAYFLYQETPSALMHTLKISVCKPGASQPSEADFRELVRRSMGCLPVFQYRVVPVPLGLHHPVVVNDGGFDYDMHVHRIAVPAPGAHNSTRSSARLRPACSSARARCGRSGSWKDSKAAASPT